ncbi:aminopeptidase [Brevibacillus sp. SYSU BS000544]|uniref:aminopeptidase n=1 Tax=Brevibacillus sp. SYSU BS000544 TaxID=3416443 RepID=UPI003CE58BFD
MKNFEQMLDRYAKLAVQVGVNIQPGQSLMLTVPIAHVKFARLIAKYAYQAGAKHVHIDWYDDELTRLTYELAPDESFTEYPQWKANGYEELAEQGAAFLHIRATDPKLLEGIDPVRIANASKAYKEAVSNFRSKIMSDRVCWSLIAIPTPAWAAMVFPELDESKQMDAMWNAIFNMVRLDQENPVQAWKDHHQFLTAKADYLNKKKYRLLQYRAPGTDLQIELPPEHLWTGGGSISETGTLFMANMPTEEVFTVPLKNGVNGTVRSSKPLSYNGVLISDFSFTFRDGRIIEFSAKTGYETLLQLVDTDEGARYLGEVALVPHNSPISLMNRIFYNSLIDENASCHLAIGDAYTICLENGRDLTPEAVKATGINSSLVHCDFMIGSEEMDVDGVTAEGVVEPIFRKGQWVF